MIKFCEFFRKNLIEIVIVVYLLGLFSYFFFGFEVKEYGDSFQLLNQFPMRDPLYSLFLKACKDLFGDKYFFDAVGLIQNAFAAISIWIVNRFLAKTFCFNKLMKVISVILLTLPHIVCPVFSSTKLILTNAILTEGVTLSIFYIWFIFMIKVLYNDKVIEDVLSFLIALILSMIRSQLLVCIVAWVVVETLKIIIKKKWLKLVWLYLLCIISLLGRTTFVRNYNEYFWDMHVDTFSGKAMMVANVLYVSDIEDGEKIESSYLKEIFNNIIVEMKEDKITYENAGRGLYNKAILHDEVHDAINFDYFEPVTREYLKRTENLDGNQFLLTMYRVDQIAGELMKELLPQVLKEYIFSYMGIVGLGLMRSVAIGFEWLIPYVVVVLLLAIIGSIYILFCKRQSESSNRTVLFMLFVLMMIFGNAMATAFMLQCISRYMIYNFPFFYIALMVMGRECFWKEKEVKCNEVSLLYWQS